MRPEIWAVTLVLAASVGAQRGVVSVVSVPRATVQQGATVDITVTGTNPCGAVRLDYGDGTERITHAITAIPVTIQYVYKQPGRYQIRAEGMGNCDGVASTELRVVPAPAPPPPPPPERPGEARFREMDENRDGVVSLNEWRGNARAFRAHDSNNDGVLTRREFPAADTVPGEGLGDYITVSPKVRWTDSGIYVREGDLVRIQATGIVQLSTNPADNGDPRGVHSGRRAPSSPLPSRPAGGLIARVGNSGPIFVGSEPSFRAPATGQLFFGVNDDELSDNKGEFRVTVDAGRRNRY